MSEKILAISLLCLVCAITIYIVSTTYEPFTTEKEKARAIYDWFISNPSPQYVTYKSDLSRKSNIVEYEDVLQLAKRGGLTYEAVSRIIV
jgi:hypothetical protein